MGAAAGVTRTPPKVEYLGPSGQLRVGKSAAPQARKALRTLFLDLWGSWYPQYGCPSYLGAGKDELRVPLHELHSCNPAPGTFPHGLLEGPEPG